ncbi:unnamed protein product [Microthlaspi erraticum]|uniref:Retrotransposon gag domain-containing protein n=1 Tax=Microthlaspi erraticum TaxID=1685480 RepID=A0A6D2HVR7_9BRAS|nr:unnamed protein product [Microthlaspi erraticum]
MRSDQRNRRTRLENKKRSSSLRPKKPCIRRQDAITSHPLAEHLRGDALAWFTNLRADSIDSFDNLAAAFLKQHLRFALDDLVLCKTDGDTIYGLGKFGPDWEGPFRIAKVVKPGVLSAGRQPRHHVRSPLELFGHAQVP